MARSEPAFIIDLTDPQKSDMADIIQFKTMTPSDPSEYDWDYILPNITEISFIYKLAIVQSVTQLNKKTISRTSKKGGTTITTYLYQPDPPADPPEQTTSTKDRVTTFIKALPHLAAQFHCLLGTFVLPVATRPADTGDKIESAKKSNGNDAEADVIQQHAEDTL
jgi:hypothetical protein